MFSMMVYVCIRVMVIVVFDVKREVTSISLFSFSFTNLPIYVPLAVITSVNLPL